MQIVRDVGPDELHGVVDGQTGRDDAARGIDVEVDVPIGIFRFEEQELRDDEVRDDVVDRLADEDDPILEQPGIDVVGPFPAPALLDHHRYQRHVLVSSLPVYRVTRPPS